MTPEESKAFRQRLESPFQFTPGAKALQALQQLLAAPEIKAYVREAGGLINENAWVGASHDPYGLQTLNLLWDAGLRIDWNASEPLLFRLINHDQPAEMLAWFLDRHVPADVRNRQGATAIAAAYERGRDDLVELLRHRGAPEDISTTHELIRAVRVGDLQRLVELRQASASPWAEGAYGDSAYRIAFDATRRAGSRQEQTLQASRLAVLIGSGHDLPPSDAPQVAALAAITGHEGLLGIARALLNPRDPSPTFFAGICEAAFDLLRGGRQLDEAGTRDFAYNLLDLCPHPTNDQLAAAYKLVLSAEQGLVEAQALHDRYSRQPAYREESAPPTSYVVHRGLIQQFFEAKEGRETYLFTDVPVYVATGRQRSTTGAGLDAFLSGPTPVPPPDLSFAVAHVAVPHFDSTIVSLAKPRFWRWCSRKQVQRFVEVLSCDLVTSAQELYEAIQERQARGQHADAPRTALVFVHGFCVTLAAAIEATANLAAKLQFAGVPFCYSWPSRGTLEGYPADEAEIPVAASRLAMLLRVLIDHFGHGAVHIVAHSMGNRVLFEALSLLKAPFLTESDEPREPRPFGQIVLNAADVPSSDYSVRVPLAAALARRVTSYSSEHDFALTASMEFHRGPRAGLERPPIGPTRCAPLIQPPSDPQTTTLVREFDAIDVSEIHDDILGHAYYRSNPRVVSDIGFVLHGISAKIRTYLQQSADYWVYQRK